MRGNGATPAGRSAPEAGAAGGPFASHAGSRDDAVAAYDYDLPESAIAQRPLADREAARLLLLDRASGRCEERVFRDLPSLLAPGDALVVNDARVVPARVRASAVSRPGEPGRAVEILILGETAPGVRRALVRPARRAPEGSVIELPGGSARARVVGTGPRGERLLAFPEGFDAARFLEEQGETPLPPYIRRAAEPADRDDYQTVYARHAGAVAAPTAGLHFTARLLDAIAVRGVAIVPVTLDVGLPTFRPLVEETLDEVRLGAERFAISEDSASAMRRARHGGGRIVAVGTTVVRVLETAWDEGERGPRPGSGETTLFVRPGRAPRAVDALITNFHLPRTSLLVLVSAFAGRERLLGAYREALARGFRFASYGDAMMIA